MSVKSNLSTEVQKRDTSLTRSHDRTSATFPGKMLSPKELSVLKSAHYPYHSFTLPKHCCVEYVLDSRPVTRRNPNDMPEESQSSTRPLAANSKSDNPCDAADMVTKDYAYSRDNYAGPLPEVSLDKQVIVGIPKSEEIQENKSEEPISQEVKDMTKQSVDMQIVVQQGPQCTETCDCACSGTNILPQIPSADYAVQAKIETPSNEKSCATSVAEHEYLQFALRITEDIIKNDLYSNVEIKRVFNSHIEANRGRLDVERMKIQLKKLALELNLSYSDILLSNADDDSDMPMSSDQRESDCCACYDLDAIKCLCGESEQYLPEAVEEITCVCEGNSTDKSIKSRSGTKHSRRRRSSRRHSLKSTERRATSKAEVKPVPKSNEKAFLKAKEKALLNAEEKAFRKAEEKAIPKTEEKDEEEPVMTMHMRSHALQQKVSSFCMQNGTPKRRSDWCTSKNQRIQPERTIKSEQTVSATVYHDKSSDTRSKVKVHVQSSIPTESTCSDCEKSVQSDILKSQERKSVQSNSSQQEKVSTLSECTCGESYDSSRSGPQQHTEIETDIKPKRQMSLRKTKDKSPYESSKTDNIKETEKKDETIKADKSTKTDICSDECQQPPTNKKTRQRHNSSKAKNRTAKSKPHTKRRSSSGPSKIQTPSKVEKLSTPNDKQTKRKGVKNLGDRVRSSTPKGIRLSSKEKSETTTLNSERVQKETIDACIPCMSDYDKDITVGSTSPIPVKVGVQSKESGVFSKSKISKTLLQADNGSQDTVELRCRKKCGSKDSVKSGGGKGKTKHHKEKSHRRSVSSEKEDSKNSKGTMCMDGSLTSISRSYKKCICESKQDGLPNLDQLAVTKLSLKRNRSHSREILDHKRPGCLATPNINVDIVVQTEARSPELKNCQFKPIVRHVSPPFTPLVQSNLVGSSYVRELDQNFPIDDNETQGGEMEGGYLMMPAPIYISPQGIGMVSPAMAYYPPGLKTIQVSPATETSLVGNDSSKSSKNSSKLRDTDTQTKSNNKGCCICPSVPSTKCTLKTCHASRNKSRDDLLLSDYYDNEIPPSVSQFFPTIATQTASSDFLMIEKILSLRSPRALEEKQKKPESSFSIEISPTSKTTIISTDTARTGRLTGLDLEDKQSYNPIEDNEEERQRDMIERQQEEQRKRAYYIVVPFAETPDEKEPEKSPEGSDALHLTRKDPQKLRSTLSRHLRSISRQLLEVGEESTSKLEEENTVETDNEATIVGTMSAENEADFDSAADLGITRITQSDTNAQEPPSQKSSTIGNEVMVGGSDDDFMKKLDHKPDMSMTTSMEQRIKKVVHESEVFRHPKEKGSDWAAQNLKLLASNTSSEEEEEEDEGPLQDSVAANLQSKFSVNEPGKMRQLEQTTTVGDNDDISPAESQIETKL